MHGITRRLHIPTTLKRYTWKIPHPIASLALIATISISAMNIQANAGDPVVDSKTKATSDQRVDALVKITDALLAGTITPEEAAKKIHETNRIDSYLSKVEAEVSDAVANGKMTVEEGMAKYDAAVIDIKQRMYGAKKNTNARVESYLKKVGTEIREAIANGEMTAEEGKAKYAEAEARVQQRMGGEKSNTNARTEVYLTKIGSEIRAAIANGEMTVEEGKEKYTAAVERIKKRMAAASKRGEREEREGFKRRIEAAVESGKMTPEESREAYADFRRRMGAKDGGDRDHRRDADRDRGEVSDDCLALRRKLGAAVRNGEMTREEAGEIWEDEGC